MEIESKSQFTEGNCSHDLSVLAQPQSKCDKARYGYTCSVSRSDVVLSIAMDSARCSDSCGQLDVERTCKFSLYELQPLRSPWNEL